MIQSTKPEKLRLSYPLIYVLVVEQNKTTLSHKSLQPSNLYRPMFSSSSKPFQNNFSSV
ncbi:hypothetical protein Fmac_003224 [Flemingia macrophylla]|uniref:Uncharacterized protein n=1 Tax=Flemingia macrophylla TaxID=520843 RepID=A0ABD1NM81_9FABA